LFDGGFLVVIDFWSAGLLLVRPQEPCNNNTGAVVALPQSQAHRSVLIPELLAEELHSLFVLGGLGT
jgi:hypothetical protein